MTGGEYWSHISQMDWKEDRDKWDREERKATHKATCAKAKQKRKKKNKTKKKKSW